MHIDQSVLDSLVENGGLIRADGGLVFMSAGAKDALLASVVNNTGVIEARTVQEHNGTIILLAGMAAGTVNVGGTLDASAPNGGNGGFIETSASRVKVAEDTKVTTAAPQGNAGNWLIDPTDYTIAAVDPANGSSYMSNATLANSLGSGNVTIQTLSTGMGNGDIFVNSAITKSASGTTSLTLQAARNINVNADITSSSGALNITLSAANAASATLGGVHVNANLASNGGNILIGGGGAGSVTNGIGYALNRSASLSAVTIETNKSITSSGGNITINGKSQVGSGGSYSGVKGGIYIRSGATILSGTGNLNMFGESSTHIKTFGLSTEAVASGSVTTLGTSATSGIAVINGINTATGTTTEQADGALDLSNLGGSGRLILLGKSVANMSVRVNNNTNLITFTPGTGCVSGYSYCGAVEVPGANSSNKFASYSVNTAATKAITVQTGDGSREYNGNTTASGLSYTVTGAPVGYVTSSLGFLTSDKNVGTYSILDNNNPAEYVSAGITYAVGYYMGNYSITAKSITASYTGIDKQYDRTTTGSVSGASSGIILGDTVSFNTTAEFTDRNVGSRSINITGASLGGTHAGNYSLASTTGSATAKITPYAVNLTGSRIYDGTVDVAAGIFNFGTLVGSETLALSGTGTVLSGNVGNTKNVTTTGLTLGDGSGLAANYTFTGGTQTADITPYAVNFTGSRIYDGTVDVAAGIFNFGTLVGSETLALSGTGTVLSGNVGNTKNVTTTGLTLGDGSGLAANYTFTGGTQTADITPLPVIVIPPAVQNVIAQLQLNALTPQVGGQSQTLNLSSTLIETQSFSTGSESSDSESVNPVADSTTMNVNTVVMGPSLQIVNIGATNATLQIVDGGMRLP